MKKYVIGLALLVITFLASYDMWLDGISIGYTDGFDDGFYSGHVTGYTAGYKQGNIELVLCLNPTLAFSSVGFDLMPDDLDCGALLESIDRVFSLTGVN